MQSEWSWFQFPVDVTVAGREAQRLIARFADSHGLGDSELLVLWYVARGDRPVISQVEIAKGLRLSSAQVSVCLEKLRSAGLLVSSRCLEDRRRQQWTATRCGIDRLGELLKSLRPELEQAIRSLAERLLPPPETAKPKRGAA